MTQLDKCPDCGGKWSRGPNSWWADDRCNGCGTHRAEAELKHAIDQRDTAWHIVNTMRKALGLWKVRLSFLGHPQEPSDWSVPVKATETAEKFAKKHVPEPKEDPCDATT